MNTLRKELDRDRSYVFCAFPEHARWSAERQAVEFGVEIRRVPRRGPRLAVFQRLLSEALTPSGASTPTTSSGPGSLELGVHRVVNTGFQTAQARVVGNAIEAFHGASFTKVE
jgi:hypothetical protein